MSTLTAALYDAARGEAARRRVLPPPNAPMAVARAIIRELYASADGPRLRYHRGLPYLWDGTCWRETAVRDVRSGAYHFLEDAHYRDDKDVEVPWAPTRRKLDDLVDALQAATLIDSQLDAPRWIGRTTNNHPASEIVAMQNGLLHVPTRTLLPHTASYFSTFALPFPFEPAAAAPMRWMDFLTELWPDDMSSISTLQEAMGYLLAGGTEQHKIFMVVGPKRGGKGTIARVLTGLLGSQNVAAPTLASLSTNFGLSPLIGKPVAIVADARLSPKTESTIVVERLLSVSGEDSLTIDRKYRDPWTGRLPTRFLILTNELPRLTDASGALASRFIAFVLTKSFYGVENPRLTDELLAEAPAIFTWALAGLDRLTHRGSFVQPDTSLEAIQRLEDLASPVSAFLRERCHVTSDERVECDLLWTAWRSWCEAENRHAGTKAVFGRDLAAAVPTMRRARPRTDEGSDRPYVYQGIGLRQQHNGEVRGPGGPAPSRSPSGPPGPRTRPMYSPPAPARERSRL